MPYPYHNVPGDENCFRQAYLKVSECLALRETGAIASGVSSMVRHFVNQGVECKLNSPLEFLMWPRRFLLLRRWVRRDMLMHEFRVRPGAVLLVYSSAFELYSISEAWTHYVVVSCCASPIVHDPWEGAPRRIDPERLIGTVAARGVRVVFWKSDVPVEG